MSTQNAAGDHVKESSHRVSSSSSCNRSRSSGDEQFHSLASFAEETSVLTTSIDEKTARQGNLALEVGKPKFQLSEAKSALLALAPPRCRSAKGDKGSFRTSPSC